MRFKRTRATRRSDFDPCALIGKDEAAGNHLIDIIVAGFEADRLPTEVLRTCPTTAWLPILIIGCLVLSGAAMASFGGLDLISHGIATAWPASSQIQH